jgi:hypothetical protein
MRLHHASFLPWVLQLLGHIPQRKDPFAPQGQQLPIVGLKNEDGELETEGWTHRSHGAELGNIGVGEYTSLVESEFSSVVLFGRTSLCERSYS